MVFLVPIAVSLLAIAFLRVLMKLWLNRYVLPLPPGPKGLPILGNVSDMPKPGVLECHHWFEHKKKYGPISSVTAMGQTIVIINDATIALDLLRGRSAIYSSRPSLTFASDMVGWRHVTAMIPYSDTWKIHRRNIKNITSTATSLAEFDRIQETETAHFLANLLEAPERLLDHIRYETGSVILKIVYGYDYNRHEGDPLVDMAETTVAQFAEALVPGSQTPSFLSQCIATIGTDADMEFIHKWTALALYLGGADTTVSALSTFFLAMSLFPSIQVAAQSELDTVLGVPPRLPTAQDLPRLPYIEAVVKETLRWHQVAPMGLPHTNTSSDTYSGYHIPQGSILLANI
ncbi:cytochrome P450 [Bipolaris maydis]|uniref:cytochrome P450 n=1 Tax=Cochliobolus heterostrophus TaxID=5016 RepID=UPI0024D7C288|nr:cytochrome P450 [Bipolaris maydis]KAJ6267540.1 cytochrome P450 [Bipolaris maydis]